MMALLTTISSPNPIWANDELSEEDLAGVVTIISGRSQGSGFFLSNSDLLTAAHVVGVQKKVSIPSADGNTEEIGTVTVINPECDVALIEFSGIDRPTLSQNSEGIELGQSVFAIGSPIGRPVLSAGKVESFDTLKIRTSVPVDSGSSGGPLLNTSREIVGLVVQKSELGNAIAIPIKQVNKCIEDARNKQVAVPGTTSFLQSSSFAAVSILAMVLSLASIFLSILTLIRLKAKKRPIVITLPTEQKDER